MLTVNNKFNIGDTVIHKSSLTSFEDLCGNPPKYFIYGIGVEVSYTNTTVYYFTREINKYSHVKDMSSITRIFEEELVSVEEYNVAWGLCDANIRL